MNIGAVLAILIVLFSLAAAVLMGNMDASSPALASQELAHGVPGAATSTIIFNQVVSVLLGILVTGMVAGVGGAVLMWTREWLQDRQSGRSDWAPGPNANFQRRSAKPQGMSRDELFQLALLNMMTQNQQRSVPQITTQTEPDDYGEF